MSDFRHKSKVSAPPAAQNRYIPARQPYDTVGSTEDRRPDLDPRAISRAVLVDVLKLLPTSIFILEQPKTAPIAGSTAVREAPEKELAQFILWAKCKPQKRNSSLCEFNHQPYVVYICMYINV